jgi:hypothetical protein
MSRIVLTSLRPTAILTSLTPRVILTSFVSHQAVAIGHAPPVFDAPYSVWFSVEGPKGDTGVNWRGEYNALATYLPTDAVAYNGSSYICKVGCTGVVPTTIANWSIMAAAVEVGTIDGGVWTP